MWPFKTIGIKFKTTLLLLNWIVIQESVQLHFKFSREMETKEWYDVSLKLYSKQGEGWLLCKLIISDCHGFYWIYLSCWCYLTWSSATPCHSLDFILSPFPFWRETLNHKYSDDECFRIHSSKVLIQALPPKPFHKVQHCHFSNCKISSSFPKLGGEIVEKWLYVPFVLTLSLRNNPSILYRE